MSGREFKLGKLCSKGEYPVIVAMDHGYINGPTEGMIDLKETIKNVDPSVDGVLMSPGMFKAIGQSIAYKGAPMPVVRLNWSPLFYGEWGSQKAYNAQAFSAKDAAKLGAEIVLVCLTLNTGDPQLDAKNVELFGRLCSEARECGIPVLGEYIPQNFDNLSEEELHEQTYRGCRIVAELGADMIKAFYTSKFDKVVEGCPVPILGLGGSRTDSPVEALQLARNIIDKGGKGVVFGRNALQRTNPIQFQKALLDVVKRGIDPSTAALTYGL